MLFIIKQKRIPLYSVGGFLVGIFFANINEIGVCTTRFCRSFIESAIGVPIGLFSIIIFLLSLILLFLRTEIYTSWWKFARIYLPVAFILIAIFPESASFLNPDRELATWWLAGLFFAISLILIAVKSWRLRKISS